MRFLRKKDKGPLGSRTTTFCLTETGFCIPVLHGIIFIDALKDIENCRKMGIDTCVQRLKAKYLMEEIDETKIDPKILDVFKEKYPSYFGKTIPEMVTKKSKPKWENRICKCGKSFSPQTPNQRYCDLCKAHRIK